MDERHGNQTSSSDCERLEIAVAQVVEAGRVYDEAVTSYNTHLENHRGRRNLDELPARQSITDAAMYQQGITGDRDALDTVLAQLLDQVHLDSAVRRHPRVYPIHLEALRHLEIARDQLIRALEDALRRMDPDT